jgi:hypothetical protein
MKKMKIREKCLMLCIVFFMMIPIVSANHPSSSTDNQSKYLPASDQVDNNDEIITFISGSNYNGIATLKWGIIRDVQMSISLGAGGFDIKGWSRNPIESFFYTGLGYIHASHFLGFCIPGLVVPGCFIFGIAFGNIEWRE